jgi:hypothetical protein
MNVNQVLNQIYDSTLGEEKTNNLIQYLYNDIINEYGGGYDSFVESYSSEVGRFDEQRDVEIIDSLYSRSVTNPNSGIQEHQLLRLEGLLDICKNKLHSEVWETIEGFMDKPINEMSKEEFDNQCMYEEVGDWLTTLKGEVNDVVLNNQHNLDEWKNGVDDKLYSRFKDKINECINSISTLDSTIKDITWNINNKQ